MLGLVGGFYFAGCFAGWVILIDEMLLLVDACWVCMCGLVGLDL